MSAKEQTEIFRRHAVIVIPANQAALLRDALHCASEAERAWDATNRLKLIEYRVQAEAATRALNRALNRVDFHSLLSVPGERPQDGTE